MRPIHAKVPNNPLGMMIIIIVETSFNPTSKLVEIQ